MKTIVSSIGVILLLCSVLFIIGYSMWVGLQNMPETPPSIMVLASATMCLGWLLVQVSRDTKK